MVHVVHVSDSYKDGDNHLTINGSNNKKKNKFDMNLMSIDSNNEYDFSSYEYDFKFYVSTAEFHKTIKDLKTFGENITLYITNEEITFLQNSKISENGPGPLPKGFENMNVSYEVKLMNYKKAIRIIENKYKIEFELIEDKNVEKKMSYFGILGSKL